MNRKNEVEISLADIFWKVLYSWKKIIIFGIVLSIVFCFTNYYKVNKVYSDAKASFNKSSEMKDELTPEEKKAVENVKVLQDRIESLQKYMEESVYLNLDAGNEPVLILNYYVDSNYHFNYTKDNKGDYTDALVGAYMNYATSGSLAEKISTKIREKVNTSYINELIRTEEYSSGLFSVSVMYHDQKTLRSISKLLEKEILAQGKQYRKQIGNHELKLVSTEITRRTDENLQDRQNLLQDRLLSYSSQITALTSTLTDTQKEVLQIGNMSVSSEEIAMVEPVKPSLSKKYAFAGFIFGILVAACYVAFKIIVSGKIQSEDYCSENYGMFNIGSLHLTRRNENNRSINKWLWKKRYHIGDITEEDEMELLTSGIDVICKKENMKQVVLYLDEVCNFQAGEQEILREKLSKRGICVAYCEQSIRTDVSALKMINESESVIMVAEIGRSSRKNLDRSLETMMGQKKKILGYICIL